MFKIFSSFVNVIAFVSSSIIKNKITLVKK